MSTPLAGITELYTPNVTIATTSGGSLTGGSGFFWIYEFNRVGRSLLGNGAASPTDAGVSLTWTASQKLQFTFPAPAAGKEIMGFGVAYAATDDVTLAQEVAQIRARGTAVSGAVNYPGQGAALTFPLTLELTTDEQIATGVIAADQASLPSSPAHGNVVNRSDLGEYWRYDSEAESGNLASGGGYWISHSTGFSAYVADIAQGAELDTRPQGSRRPLNSITPGVESDVVIPTPAYLFDGSVQDASYAPEFHVAGPIPQGSRIEINFYVNGTNYSTAFSGQLTATLLGKASLTDGTLDTTASGVGSPITLSKGEIGVGVLETPEELEEGFTWVYRVQLASDSSAIATPDRPIQQGDTLTYYPFVVGTLGERIAFSDVSGEGVSSIDEKLVVLPSTGTAKATIQAGSAFVIDDSTTVGHLARSKSVRDVDGVLASTDSQKVALNGPFNDVVVKTGALEDWEAQRALVGTGLGPDSGRYSASTTSSSVAIAGNSDTLQIVVTHPTGIRNDYPDDQIAGHTADFNPNQIGVLVTFSGTIYDVVQVARGASPQTINITDLGATTVGSAYDSSATPEFGLFGYDTITPSAVTSPSSLAAGNYQVQLYYIYDGSQVTSISHSTNDGCIPVADLDYFQLLAARGQTGFTSTTADFTQPAVASSATVSVNSSAFMVAGQLMLVEGGGEYIVSSTPTASSVILENTGAGGNASPGATISTGAKVTPTGASGNSAYGLFYVFDTGTTAGAASSEIRLNDADPTAATALYVSETSAGGLDSIPLISSLSVGSKLRIQDQDSAAVHLYDVSGAITDNGSDRTIPVTHDTGTGTFSDGNSLFLTPALKGDTGNPGNDGAAATITVNSTTTVAPGQAASVTNSGSTAAAALDFNIPQGAAGVPFGTRHNFDAATTSTPASGEIRANDADLSLATELYVHETDRDALDISNLTTNIPNGSRISIVDDGNASAIAYFSVTSSSSASSVTTLVVTHLAGSPTIADGANVTLQTEGKGDTGDTGAAGVDAGLQYEFDSGTTSGAAAGEIRLNNATIASATQIFVNATDRNAVDLASFWDEVNVSTLIQIQSQVTASTYALFQITGQAGTTERTLNVTHLGSNGTFSDADDVGLGFFLKGDTGANGTNGADGLDAGLSYEFDSGTGAGANTGEVRFNNADPSLATIVYVNGTDDDGVDSEPYWDEVTDGSLLHVKKAAAYVLFTIDSQTGTTERSLTVSYLGGIGTFSDADKVSLITSLKGSQGAAGDVTYGAISTNAQAGTSYTLVLSDRGKVLEMDNASDITITIPPNASVAFSVGDQILVSQENAGTVTIAPDTGVTVNSPGGLRTRAQYSVATLRYRGSDDWRVIGDTQL